MDVVNHKYILRYKTWDTKKQAHNDYVEEEYEVGVHKTKEQIFERLRKLLSQNDNLYLQLLAGTIPDKGDLLNRTLILGWNPVSQVFQLLLPYATVIIHRQSEAEMYEWLENEFRRRNDVFDAQITNNPHWLSFLNTNAFEGVYLK